MIQDTTTTTSVPYMYFSVRIMETLSRVVYCDPISVLLTHSSLALHRRNKARGVDP